MNILVAGAGGAIGGHLVNHLINQGHDVRAVDVKPKNEWWQVNPKAVSFGTYNLAHFKNAYEATSGVQQVYDLAENMGGIGYITEHRVDCATSIRIGMNMLEAAEKARVERFFFSSSACIYNTDRQTHGRTDITTGIREEDAWPAKPEEGYGLSKLYMEELCRYYTEEGRLQTRVARYHNVFGPCGSWNDGKEKAPAAICRKVYDAQHQAHYAGEIEIWGDGNQVRSYLNVFDCVSGTVKLMNSEYALPINIGSNMEITVNDLVSVVEQIANIKLVRRYKLDAATGVEARNADISLAKKELDWEPQITLHTGMKMLYHWIRLQRQGAK